jgi:hypothetical protein
MADYGEANETLPIDSKRNETTCRRIEKTRTAFRNPCHLPPQRVILGTGQKH